MKRVFAYVRVSTQEQAREGYSIGEQIERLTKFCEAHDWLVANVYTDAGFSGGNTNRPALQEMLSDIKKGKCDCVIVYKLDRLSRSQKDTLELIEDFFLRNGVDFISMTENFDTSTPFGKAMVGILAVFAQLEREQIKERMEMGKEARLKEGKWTGSSPPFGYDFVDGQLIVNDYEAMIVREIFDMFIKGVPLNKIANSLNSRGFLRKNKYEWTNTIVRYILLNSAYNGQVKLHSGEWIDGIHDPIIDPVTFEKAQSLLSERKRKYEESGIKAGRANITTYLGGMIFCKHCGGKYAKIRSGNRRSGYRLKYACYSRTKKVKHMVVDPACRNKIYNCDDLDNIVFNEIRKLATDPSYMQTLRDQKNSSEMSQRIRMIKSQIRQLDSQVSRFMDLYGLGTFDVQQLDSKITPLNEQKLRLSAELSKLESESAVMEQEDATALIASFQDILDGGEFHEIRAFLELLIDHIEIDNDDVIIHWNFV